MERPLPNGWISQVDPNSGHRFYVDTKATPPRSIWVHPLEDEQYLREHPDAREKSSAADEKAPRYSAPPTPAATPGAGSSSDRAGYASPSGPKKKHGFLDKMKEKFVGTEEEREQERRHKAETKRQMMLLREQRHQEMLAQQAAAYQQQQREQQLYAEQQRAYGQQAQYAPQQYAYGPPPQQQRSGFGGGGMAMPLLGGLAGGLLLGEALDGFGGDGGDGGDW